MGSVMAAPYGFRAFALHRSLPDARHVAPGGAGQQQQLPATVSILRDVK